MSEDDLLRDQRGSPAYISPDVLSGRPYLGEKNSLRLETAWNSLKAELNSLLRALLQDFTTLCIICKGKPSDLWALGVVLFTMLYGQFPFYDSVPQELFRKIKAAEFSIPKWVRKLTQFQISWFIRRLFFIYLLLGTAASPTTRPCWYDTSWIWTPIKGWRPARSSISSIPPSRPIIWNRPPKSGPFYSWSPTRTRPPKSCCNRPQRKPPQPNQISNEYWNNYRYERYKKYNEIREGFNIGLGPDWDLNSYKQIDPKNKAICLDFWSFFLFNRWINIPKK